MKLVKNKPILHPHSCKNANLDLNLFIMKSSSKKITAKNSLKNQEIKSKSVSKDDNMESNNEEEHGFLNKKI